MKNVKKIIIQDDGIAKTFLIKKATGMVAFDLFMDINRVIEKSEGLYAPIAQQFMHNCMQTGVNVGNVESSKVNQVIQENSQELLYFIFNSFFKGLDKETRDDILEQIFSLVIFKNGEFDVKLTTLKNSTVAENVDLYITEINTIFTICCEFMRLNYAHFLPQMANQATNSSEDLKTN